VKYQRKIRKKKKQAEAQKAKQRPSWWPTGEDVSLILAFLFSLILIYISWFKSDEIGRYIHGP